MENTKKSPTKPRITVTLSKSCMTELKRRSKANFRDVSGELEAILSTVFNEEEHQSTPISD